MEDRDESKNKETKTERFQIRMDADEREMLDYLSLETGMSKADVVRKALRVQYNLKINGY